MNDRRRWLIVGLLVLALFMVWDIHSNGFDFAQGFVKNLIRIEVVANQYR